jgi:hypothetical protein
MKLSVFRFLKKFGVAARSDRVLVQRQRSFQPRLEGLEERQLLSTLSAIGDYQANRVVYAIAGDNSVWMNVNGGASTSLGGNVTQISAGLDAQGFAQVFGISGTSVWVNDSGGTGNWQFLFGQNITQISAGYNNEVFGLVGGSVVSFRHACMNHRR